MKRFLIAIAALGVLATAAFGSAATLDVVGGTLQVGSTDGSVKCTDSVKINGLVVNEANTEDYPLVGINMAAVPDCVGKFMFAVIKDSGSNVIGYAHPNPAVGSNCDSGVTTHAWNPANVVPAGNFYMCVTNASGGAAGVATSPSNTFPRGADVYTVDFIIGD